MTVAELIKALQEFPPDMEVKIAAFPWDMPISLRERTDLEPQPYLAMAIIYFTPQGT